MTSSLRQLITVFGMLGCTIAASQVLAQQSPAQILQSFGGIGTAGFGAGGPRPNPLGAGGPQMLPSAMPPQIERICKFENLDDLLSDAGEDVRSRASEYLNNQEALQRLQIESLQRQRAGRGNTDSNSVDPIIRPRFQLYRPNVFERYVKSVTGQELCRFGFQTLFGGTAFFEPPPLAMAPDDYMLGPGDEVFVRLWGTIEQDFAAVIDRAGLIVIPKVGPVRLAGTRLGQAANTLRAAIRKNFSDFNISVTAGQLRGIKVYITGFAERPGALDVSNFSSLSSVVFASGGPSSAGSFRNIELRRNGEVIARLDLYDLLIKGDKRGDRMLVSEDVIHFGPIGPQVAVLGGVNKPAVFEVRSGETAHDVIRMAGNFSPGAAASPVNRLSITNRAGGFVSHPSADLASLRLADGDILIAQDSSNLQVPKDKMAKRVVLQGHVQNPGEYVLPADATLKTAIDRAGGLTNSAFLFGLKLTRRSILEEQRATIRRVLREFDRDYVSQGTVRPIDQTDAQMMSARLEFGQKVLSRLQTFEPEGRLVLPIKPDSKEIPDVRLEDGDVVSVPPAPASIGVFGSVISPGNYAFISKGGMTDYLSLAGGPSKGADSGQIFVIQANGQARKNVAQLPFWGRRKSAESTVELMPGDTIVVPEDMNKTVFTRQVVQWSQILYQLGLGAAAIKVLQQ
jgi:protein involved in polysaccharide export with SLBB domain